MLEFKQEQKHTPIGAWDSLNMNTNELTELIVEFYEKLSAWEDSVVKDSGLTTSQNHTIEIVGHAGSIKMKHLAEKVGVTTGTLTVNIDKLEKMGLLKRVPHQTDRRSILIELTGKGKTVYQHHYNHHYKLTRAIVADLSKEEQIVFSSAIQKALKKM